jgi:SAM-dependent methyltransferase
MALTTERYDRIADGYARFWGPVIAPWGIKVLDLIEDDIAAGAREVLDLGTGTGRVAFEAVRRWPDVRVTAIDPSSGMLATAKRLAGDELTFQQRRRLELVEAFGDNLGGAVGRFDVGVSAFVLQLVPSRGRVLREVRRVLRGGGRFAYVSWLAGRGEARFAGDAILDDVLDEAGFDPPAPDPRPGDLPSVEAAASGLRAAGFRTVRAFDDELIQPWTADSYTAFITEFDEADTFESMSVRERKHAIARLRREFGALPPAEQAMRLPVVYATGVRS